MKKILENNEEINTNSLNKSLMDVFNNDEKIKELEQKLKESENKLLNKKSFKRVDTIIFNLSNIEFINYEDYISKITNILSLCSYLIKHGGNILIICHNIVSDVDIDTLLKNTLLWNKRRTIVYKSELRKHDLLDSSYSYVLWYSDNFRNNDPIPTCNSKNFSDFWDDIKSIHNIYENIINIFSNENDIIFDPCINDSDIDLLCTNLNRNFIGVKYV